MAPPGEAYISLRSPTSPARLGAALQTKIALRGLRFFPLDPLGGAMEISSKLGAGLQYEVAVAAKQQQSTREQGRQAVALIEAASAPQKALPSGVGGRLNVVA